MANIGVGLGSTTLINIGGASTTSRISTTTTSTSTTSANLFGFTNAPALNGLSLTSGLPLLVENVLPPLLNSTLFDHVFYSLRSAWSSDLMPVDILEATQNVPDFDFTNVNTILPIGQAFTLFASLPKPGSVVSLPITLASSQSVPVANGNGTSSNSTASPSSTSSIASNGTTTTSIAGSSPSSATTNTTSSTVTAQPSSAPSSNYTLFTIPEGALVTSQWMFFKKDKDDASFVPARRASSSTDRLGHYQVLNGTEFDTVSGPSKYIFWPANSTDPTDIRQVAACLNTTVFVPGSTEKPVVAPLYCLGGKVQSWADVLGTVSGGIIQQSPGNLKFPSSFQNLFSISVDTSTPLAGSPVLLKVLPIDKTALLAPRVESILENTPDLKYTAAIDVGAPLNAFINSVGKSITGLFKPGSGSSGVANKVSGGVLSVASVLEGLLTIPLALDVQGRQLTKTLKPLLGEDSFPNIQPLQGSSSLAGSLPIGDLSAQITSLANSITLRPLSDDFFFLPNVVDTLHGLTIDLFPDFISAGASRLPKKVSFEVGLQPSIHLPGFANALTQNITLGTISITLPTITLPQIALFFHDDPYLSDSQPDILVAIDPVTFRLVNTAASLTTLLTDLNLILSQIRQVFPATSFPAIKNAISTSLDKLLNTAGSMARFAQVAPAQGERGWLRIVDLSLPGTYGFNTDTFSWNRNDENGVTSILYIGAPSTPGYYLFADLGNRDGEGSLFFQGDADSLFSAYMVDQEHYSSSVRWTSAQQSKVDPMLNLNYPRDQVPLSGSTHAKNTDNKVQWINFRRVV